QLFVETSGSSEVAGGAVSVSETAGAEIEAISGPDELAYVIFTSGSTGMPKGVMIAQRGMLNHLHVKCRDLGLGATDVVAQNAPQSFDISIWQMLSPLLVGARVEIISDEEGRDPAELLKTVEERGVTVLETVPSMLRAMVEWAESADGARPGLGRLR